jgi:dipeptide/tripeptide permease
MVQHSEKAKEANLLDTHQPVKAKKPNKLWGVCMFILIVEMCERFCFYTLYNTYPQYLNYAGPGRQGLGMGAAQGMKQSFKMLAYVAPLLGGYLADNVMGRYKTILWFTICYVVGMVFVAVSAVNPIMESQSIGRSIFVVGSFVFVAFGTGAIKPNVVNFGAEQYDESDPEEAEQQKAYFSYFYLVINIGGLFASVWMPGLTTSEVTTNNVGNGFFYSYLIAAIAMGVSLLVYLAGTGKYSPASKAVPARSSMLSIVSRHVREGARRSWQGKLSILGLLLVPVYLCVSLAASLAPADLLSIFSTSASSGLSILRLLALLLCIISCACLIVAHRKNDWIQPPLHGQVEGELTTDEVRGFFRALPTIICVTVGFNVCYGGMDIYPIQACQMDTQTGLPTWLNAFFFLNPENPQFNSVFYGLGNNIAIIVAIPIVEGLVWPAVRKCRGGRPVSRMTKFNLGFFFCLVSIVVGVIIEDIRRRRSDEGDFVMCPSNFMGPDPQGNNQCFCQLPSGAEDITGNECLLKGGVALLVSNCAAKNAPMTAMNAWWTFLPFFLTGVGEILVNPVIQEFSYDEVSPRLKSLLMGVTMVVMGCIPAVIGGGFAGFIPDRNLNNGNVNFVFYAYFACGVLLLLAYWLIALPERDRAHAASHGASAA